MMFYQEYNRHVVRLMLIDNKELQRKKESALRRANKIIDDFYEGHEGQKSWDHGDQGGGGSSQKSGNSYKGERGFHV